MKNKTFVFDRSKAIYSKDGCVAITHKGNIPKIELYSEMAYRDFAIWNIEQEKKADWWIATAVNYSLIQIASYLGYELREFKVYIPKVTRPIFFELNDMCLLAAPYCGYNWTGVMDWKEQPQTEPQENSVPNLSKGE